MLVVVLLRPQLVLDDEGVGGGEVGHRARVKFATWKLNEKKKWQFGIKAQILSLTIICTHSRNHDLFNCHL